MQSDCLTGNRGIESACVDSCGQHVNDRNGQVEGIAVCLTIIDDDRDGQRAVEVVYRCDDISNMGVVRSIVDDQSEPGWIVHIIAIVHVQV